MRLANIQIETRNVSVPMARKTDRLPDSHKQMHKCKTFANVSPHCNALTHGEVVFCAHVYAMSM